MLTANSVSQMPMKFFDDPVIRARADRTFFVGMALAMVAMDGLGFGIAFRKTNIAQELNSTWVKVHVFLFTAWIFLFLAQAALIAARRTDLHRKLGIVGAADCGLMILITVGVIFLVGQYTRYGFGDLWPVLLIVVGAIAVAQAFASRGEHTGS